MLGTSVFAISFNLDIKGDKTVATGETIQLKAEYWVGNNTFDVEGNATREQALLISERSTEKFKH